MQAASRAAAEEMALNQTQPGEGATVNEHINIETLPVSWFPDLEAVLTFLQGPRYEALSSLALGAYYSELPEPLADEARQAGFFVGGST